MVECNILSIFFLVLLLCHYPIYSFHSISYPMIHSTFNCKMKSQDVFSSLPSAYQWTVREEERDKTIHFEVFPAFYPRWIITCLSRTQTLKPLAKVGVRTYSTSSQAMDDVIATLSLPSTRLPHSPERGSVTAVRPTNPTSIPTKGHPYRPQQGKWSIGLFVYMWVNPSYRGQGLGEVLLETGKDYCRGKGDSHMILVHDDDGSGRLVQYYEDRGFLPIETILDKGMICKLY